MRQPFDDSDGGFGWQSEKKGARMDAQELEEPEDPPDVEAEVYPLWLSAPSSHGPQEKGRAIRRRILKRSKDEGRG